MGSLISSFTKSLLAVALAGSLLPGCISVPKQVQLTHNSNPVTGCGMDISIPPRSKELDGERFSVSSWNIYKGSLTGWEKDLDHLNQQSDLLLLQEAHLVPGFKQWLEQRSLDWAMVHAFTLFGNWSGVLTSGKIPQLSPCAMRTYEPYLRVPKTALISYFPLKGHSNPLLVANIHAVNFTLGSSELATQLQAIREVIDEHSGPVILAGDFNTWTSTRMQVLRQLADSHGLQAVTFKSQQPSGRFGHQLDHIYYRGLTPLGSRVTELKSSDHYPLTATFRLDTGTCTSC